MQPAALKVGRYALGERIAAGGMATVHLGRLDGSAGFSRTVAIKRLHPHLCEDPSFTGAFADEARLAARIRHPNVVPTLDVVSTEGELLIVMEYVDGDSLSSLVLQMNGAPIPLPIVVAIVSEMLHGLHSAHEAKSESGRPLDIVHRDVSPQNVLVGADGVARLVDFGVARASSKTRQATTGENELKGKLSYMAPEQIRREDVTRRTDIYAAGIVLWELLTGERLFASDNEAATIEKILVGWVAPPRTIRMDVPDALNEIALRALDPEPQNRFGTAREMAIALEDALGRALGREVGAWVEKTAAETLATRRAMIARAEKESAPNATHTDLSNIAASVAADAPTTPRHERFVKPTPKAALEPMLGPSAKASEAVPEPMPEPLPKPEPSTGPGYPPAAISAVPFGIEYERTITSFGEERSPKPPPRSRTDRAAYAVFGLAVLVTVIVVLSWSKIRGDASPALTVTPREEPVVLTADPIVTPPPVVEPREEPVVEPVVEKAVVEKAVVEKAVEKVVEKPVSPLARPAIRPRPRASAAAKTPCTSRVDPTTNKTIYQGDCN